MFIIASHKKNPHLPSQGACYPCPKLVVPSKQSFWPRNKKIWLCTTHNWLCLHCHNFSNSWTIPKTPTQHFTIFKVNWLCLHCHQNRSTYTSPEEAVALAWKVWRWKSRFSLCCCKWSGGETEWRRATVFFFRALLIQRPFWLWQAWKRHQISTAQPEYQARKPPPLSVMSHVSCWTELPQLLPPY